MLDDIAQRFGGKLSEGRGSELTHCHANAEKRHTCKAYWQRCVSPCMCVTSVMINQNILFPSVE
ncbi:hypothetical protein E2C01_056331 [Portunus trituberculatus]|uniref:Uncharacterized protein n=1 Tax=Portunus trituberculatus TaxID=210409 RepID=A0A5B7GZB6_PORTR|nr:hypothetical protein [Portunus trituberculatus]